MNDKKIGVVYFSKTGATKLVAQNIVEGIEHHPQVSSISIEILPSEIVEGRYINQEKIEQLNDCDAILFGSPTYMGSPSAQFKSFMDASSEQYCRKAWRNKLAGGFTTGGSINGEQQQTLLSFFALACQHGMLWVGLDASKHTDDLGLNRTGSNIGLVSSAGEESLIHENDLQTAFYYGDRFAQLVCAK
ncbi:flavodoxin family protein [Vibrio sp. T187]|uniref:flavodoxin family protein n=1 Tax=Vibrio TaxID=662 RepID=UPI0010C953A9|nr:MULTISPECIES: flavodoxin family protein [Vibrio]MBW3697116.1 flavodoxin family protein [Vibrio sp. T187]